MFGKDKSQASAEVQRIAKLEAELKEKNAEAVRLYRMLESVNKSTHLGIWIAYFDEQGNPGDVKYTDEMRKMLGYSKTELPDTPTSLGKVIHPDEVEMVFDVYGKAVADRNAKFDIDYRLLMKNGEYKLFHAAGECLRRPDGSPEVFIGTFTDIDEQTKREEILLHDQRRQSAVDKMMLEGSWSMDLTKYAIDDVNSPMVYSPQFKKILGFNPNSSADFPDIMQSWITRIHPEDVQGASELMGKQLSDSTGNTVFDMEYRVRHKDGHYVWVRASSYVVWEGRTPVMAAGTILDISEEKETQLDFSEKLAPEIENLTDRIEEVTAAVEEAAKEMQEVAKNQAEIADESANIEKSVDDSMEIIKIIESIATQTNLLSLNASIEAARAGEAGKGFAVVASEVQSLASSTTETTSNISQILGEMNRQIKDIMVRISTISDSTTTQSANMEEINSTIEDIKGLASNIEKMTRQLYK
ncbi:MAG: PAS domain-containing protein [Eubacterium sp.]|nr:PAS domain-containing protein [Eubacterium sp.]